MRLPHLACLASLICACGTQTDPPTTSPDASAMSEAVTDAPAAASAVAPPAADPGPEADPMRCAQMTIDGPRPPDCAYPADVLAFLDARANCEHWLGEPDFSDARRREIARAVEDTCTGLDTRLGGLRRTHAGDAATAALLARLDPLGTP